MPLFTWAIYGTSIIMVLATPVLGMALALVGLDHGLGLGIFDPAVGGDPVLFQHIFWFYSHPAVYIMILPAMGVISDVVPTFAHRRPASYTAIAVSTIGIAVVGFLTWGHHMFVGRHERARRRLLRRALDVRRRLLRHQSVHLDARRCARARSSSTRRCSTSSPSSSCSSSAA